MFQEQLLVKCFLLSVTYYVSMLWIFVLILTMDDSGVFVRLTYLLFNDEENEENVEFPA